jgi:hypothetical protein
MFAFAAAINGRQTAYGPPGQALDRATIEATYGSEQIVLDEHGPPER